MYLSLSSLQINLNKTKCSLHIIKSVIMLSASFFSIFPPNANCNCYFFFFNFLLLISIAYHISVPLLSAWCLLVTATKKLKAGKQNCQAQKVFSVEQKSVWITSQNTRSVLGGKDFFQKDEVARRPNSRKSEC